MKIQLPKPCSKRWSELETNADGRFCATCQHTILDFTRMSDAELLSFLQTQPRVHCGRFRRDQLDRVLLRRPALSTRRQQAWGMLLAAGMWLAGGDVYGMPTDAAIRVYREDAINRVSTPDNTGISGRLIDVQTSEPIANASIRLMKGTLLISSTTTDRLGNFAFKEVDVTDNDNWRIEISHSDYRAFTLQLDSKNARRAFILQATPSDPDYYKKKTVDTRISGKLLDIESGKPIQGLNLELLRGDSLVFKTQSDSLGNFAFPKTTIQNDGSYRLSISDSRDLQGYMPLEITLDWKNVKREFFLQMTHYDDVMGIITY